jgi:tryptophan 2,3-dioxygenase
MHSTHTQDTHISSEDKYYDYLKIESLLTLQNPKSTASHEMLFIIIHQVSELWISLILHEIDVLTTEIKSQEFRKIFKTCCRIKKIQRQLLGVWEVTTTMTSTDYLTFRDSLGVASGFQSYQYRALEFKLGIKDESYLQHFVDHQPVHQILKHHLLEPSLYDHVLDLLPHYDFTIDPSVIHRDLKLPYQSHFSVSQVWRAIYNNTHKYWDLYELAEHLLDIESLFHQWKFIHYKSVERLIGRRMGTGGTQGLSYLTQRLDKKIFPEIFHAQSININS